MTAVVASVIDIKYVQIGHDELQAVRDTLVTADLSGKAEVVGRYEQELASWFEARFAVACSSGTAAIHLSLLALELATEVGDAYLQATALSYAGLATEEHGHPDDGLKMLQYGQVKAWDIPADDQRKRVGGRAPERLWRPVRGRTPRPPWPALGAGTPPMPSWRRRGSCGIPRPPTPTAISTTWPRAWRSPAGGWTLRSPSPRRRSGAGRGAAAITGVLKLSSVRARQHLEPLVAALETRPGSDHRELARMARQVAATRA